MKAFFQELFHTGLYKRNQGRVTRQVTFAAVAVVLALGCWRLSATLEDAQWTEALHAYGFHFLLPGMLLVAGLWMAYRLVNVPGVADFLIAVEAEMNKVSWPTRSELFRSSIVVLVTIFALAAVLFGYDFYWATWFKILRIMPGEATAAARYVVIGITAGAGVAIVAAIAARKPRR